jgi:hypothetical protein
MGVSGLLLEVLKRSLCEIGSTETEVDANNERHSRIRRHCNERSESSCRNQSDKNPIETSRLREDGCGNRTSLPSFECGM